MLLTKLTNRILLLFLFCLSFFYEARATHMMGAEISYRFLDTLKYEVTVKYYRNCGGIPLTIGPNDFTVRCSNGTIRAVTLTRQSIREITPLAIGTNAQCSPQNTSTWINEGVEEHVYTATLDFNVAPLNVLKNCTGKIILETGQCCRNGAVNTGVQGDFTVAAEFDLRNAPNNSSPQFGLSPITYLCCNQPARLSAAGIQTDGDSLSFSWDEPFGSSINQKLSYSGNNYAYDHPFQAYYPGITKPPFNHPTANPPIGIHLDRATGDVIFTPTRCDEVTVAKLRITEWRKDVNGVYKEIGYVARDLQVITKVCPVNNPPIFTSVLNDSFEITGCVQNFNLTVEVDDKQFIPPPPTAPLPPDTVRYIIPKNWPDGIEYTIIDPDSLHPKLEIQISNLYLQSQNYRQHTLNLPVEIRDNAAPLNAVSQATVQVHFTKDSMSSTSRISGSIIDDTDKNCSKGASEDSLSIQREIVVKDKQQTYYLNSETDGTFDFCIKSDSIKIGLSPALWFENNCDLAKFDAKPDTSYEITLFTKMKDGVYGHIFYNSDSSCAYKSSTSTEVGLKLQLQPGNKLVTTDNKGMYLFSDLSVGTYTIKPIIDSSSSLSLKCKDSVRFYYTGSGSLKADTLYTYNKIKYDPSVRSINGFDRFLFRGRASRKQFTIQNPEGFDSINLYLKVPADISITKANQYTWQNLGSGLYKATYYSDSTSNSFSLNMLPPPALYQRGDTVKARLYIDNNPIDSDTTNNSVDIDFIIRAPYDPNIKITQQDSIFTVNNRYLDYTIYFQNTGDAPAAKVVVRDTLPAELEYTKIQFLGASHDYYPLMENNKIWFIFDDIYLPDSTEDRDGSIGQVTFRVPILDSIFEETSIRNKASIYFDFEDPIVTPTKVNLFKSPTELVTSKDIYCPYDTIEVSVNCNFIPETGNIYYLEITDSSGDFSSFSRVDSVVSSNSSEKLSFKLNEELLPSENYQLRISTSDYPSTTFSDSYKQITVSESLAPVLSTATSNICFGDKVTVEANTTGDAITWVLNNDTTSSTSYKSNTLDDGDLLYASISKDGCYFNSDSIVFQVGNKPTIDISIDSVHCSDNIAINFDPQITLQGNGADAIKQLTYDFGDGNIEIENDVVSKNHNYSIGQYIFTLSVETDKGCRDTFENSVSINPESNANFSVNNVCLGDSTRLLNTSTTPLANIEYYLGDGNHIELASDSASHLYAKSAVYNVTQIATLGVCKDTIVKQATVYANPVASFSVLSSDTNKSVVEITNNTSGASAYFWDFGDGKSSIDSSLVFSHQYDALGIYTIELLAKSNNGCRDSLSEGVEIKTNAVNLVSISQFDFIVPSLYTPNGDGLNDNFIIRPLESIRSIDFKLYNIYGQLILTSTNKDKLISSDLAQGMYVYAIEITDIQNRIHTVNGKVKVAK